jgi:hypothetical protein
MPPDFLFLLTASRSNKNRGVAETSPFHNYHLSIFSFLSHYLQAAGASLEGMPDLPQDTLSIGAPLTCCSHAALLPPGGGWDWWT